MSFNPVNPSRGDRDEVNSLVMCQCCRSVQADKDGLCDDCFFACHPSIGCQL